MPTHSPRPRKAPRLLLAITLFTGITTSGSLLAGIEGTKHNLSKFGGDGGNATEICVFCHTPQGDDRTAMVPLWAPSERKPISYATYDTLGRTALGTTDSIGSVSVACLSCHDETQALGITNLAYDHPYGVAYRGEADQNSYEAAAASAEHQATPYRRATRIIDTEFKRPEWAIIDDAPIWWVDTGEEGRQRTDIQLFTRHIPELGTTLPYIECASCHDPHNSNTTFLRVTNGASQLCLTCHEGKR